MINWVTWCIGVCMHIDLNSRVTHTDSGPCLFESSCPVVLIPLQFTRRLHCQQQAGFPSSSGTLECRVMVISCTKVNLFHSDFILVHFCNHNRYKCVIWDQQLVPSLQFHRELELSKETFLKLTVPDRSHSRSGTLCCIVGSLQWGPRSRACRIWRAV